MKIATTGAPNASVAGPRCRFGPLKPRQAVEPLAVESVDRRPASTELSDFQLAAGDESVGQQAAILVMVVGYGVEPKADLGSVRRKTPHRSRGGS